MKTQNRAQPNCAQARREMQNQLRLSACVLRKRYEIPLPSKLFPNVKLFLKGTSFFMSTEVQYGKYIYNVSPDTPQFEELEDIHETMARTESIESTTPSVEDKYPLPFAHNYLHDMESIFWIAIWFIFRLPLLPLPSNDEGNLVTWEELLASIFTRDGSCPGSRRDFFENEEGFFLVMRRLQISNDSECQGSKALRSIILELNSVRKCLVGGYRTVELKPGFPDDHEDFPKVTAHVAHGLLRVLRHADKLTAWIEQESGMNQWSEEALKENMARKNAVAEDDGAAVEEEEDSAPGGFKIPWQFPASSMAQSGSTLQTTRAVRHSEQKAVGHRKRSNRHLDDDVEVETEGRSVPKRRKGGDSNAGQTSSTPTGPPPRRSTRMHAPRKYPR
jgi:hypothetical protein